MTAPTSAAPAPSGVCGTSGGIDANGKSVGLGSDFPRALTSFSSGPHAEPDETEATSPRCSFTATYMVHYYWYSRARAVVQYRLPPSEPGSGRRPDASRDVNVRDDEGTSELGSDSPMPARRS